MKIHELAKELGADNKAILDYLVSKGAQVKNHMSNIPDSMLEDVKKKFARTEVPAGGVKAVAVPDFILKQINAANKAKEEAARAEESKPEEEKTEPEKKAETSEEPKKKKKITGVFNPQYSANRKAPAPNQGSKPVQNKEPVKNRPLPSQIRPARDRKPDDYVEPETAGSSQSDAAAALAKQEAAAAASAANAAAVKAEDNTVKAAPDVKEPQKNTETDTAAPEVSLAVSEKDGKKNEEKSEGKIERKTEIIEKNDDKSAASDASKEQKHPGGDGQNRKNAQEKGTADRTKPAEPASKESEAIKSLRAKLVKGTVNPDDLMVSTRPARKQSGQGDKNNSRNGQRNNGTGQGQKNSQGQNKNGRFSTAGGSKFNKDSSNSQNQDSRQNTQRRTAAASTQSAPSGDFGKGKNAGKGKSTGKGRDSKRNGQDKFDRLENERGAQRVAKNQVKEEPEEEIKVITLPESIYLKDFAAKLRMQPAALVKKLFLAGKMYTPNDVLDFETAEEIALEMDIICEHEVVVDQIEELLKENEEDESLMVKRPPVVCIMGHVDHGKTSLLDAIRKTNVTAGEAGGITQHIGAYTVDVNGESITFLDTPGHEAFTAMRLRGAQSTDVAILVVAADDGVMPQTIEAINHAKAANIHVIVAVNKIDKPGANVDRVKQELSEYGLLAGDWGGDTIFVPISAKTGEGIEELLEMVILDTEILELRANPDRKARGVVIEAKLDKGRGSVATLLVQKGTLKAGDFVAMGESYGKVRVMTNDKGQRIKAALPSTPVEITGLNGVPNAGDIFVAFDSEKEAKNFSAVYIEENKKKLLAGSRGKMNLDDVFAQIKAGELKELNIIIKADVQGSVEAIKESLEKLSNDEVRVRCIHSGAGNVSESDVTLASASNAIIIAFNVDANPDAKATIEREKVDMRKYSVIYNAIDDVEAAMKGMLEPVYEERIIGHAEVRQTFKASGIGIIAGSYVTDGIVKRGCRIRLSRDGSQLFDGDIASLKRFTDDVKEVRSGFECGIVLKDFQDIKEGDTMEVYEMVEVPRQ